MNPYTCYKHDLASFPLFFTWLLYVLLFVLFSEQKRLTTTIQLPYLRICTQDGCQLSITNLLLPKGNSTTVVQAETVVTQSRN